MVLILKAFYRTADFDYRCSIRSTRGLSHMYFITNSYHNVVDYHIQVEYDISRLSAFIYDIIQSQSSSYIACTRSGIHTKKITFLVPLWEQLMSSNPLVTHFAAYL